MKTHALKTHALAFAAGCFLTLAALAYAGPEFLIQTGLRYEAARTEYVFQARPLDALDTSDVPAVLAEAPRRKVKR